jgi:hypothetical protein
MRFTTVGAEQLEFRTGQEPRISRELAGIFLAGIEGKALVDDVAGAGGAQDAFVEKEFLSDKAGELWRGADSGLEFVEFLPRFLAFAARESDVGLVGASLGDEPAARRGGYDVFLKLKQLRREPDRGDENPGAKDAQPFQLHRNGREMQFVKARDEARVLFRSGVAEKLEGDMPGFRRCPAQAVRYRLKAPADRRQFVEDSSCQGDSNKQTHRSIMA